jgi:hypothetical protein
MARRGVGSAGSGISVSLGGLTRVAVRAGGSAAVGAAAVSVAKILAAMAASVAGASGVGAADMQPAASAMLAAARTKRASGLLDEGIVAPSVEDEDRYLTASGCASAPLESWRLLQAALPRMRSESDCDGDL